MTTELEPVATEHGEQCGCQRCRGFVPGEPGPALRHGAYSTLALQPRAREIREQAIEPFVPFATAADGPMIALAAMTLAQAERGALHLALAQSENAAARSLGEPEPYADLGRLSQDVRGWINTAARILDSLGMSPTSRARLAGDLAGAEKTLTAAALRERYLRDASSEAAA